MDGLHISSFIDQHNASARVLARYGHLLADNWHSNNIRESAQAMVDQGKGSWTYGGQFSSGNCWWKSQYDPTGITEIVPLN